MPRLQPERRSTGKCRLNPPFRPNNIHLAGLTPQPRCRRRPPGKSHLRQMCFRHSILPAHWTRLNQPARKQEPVAAVEAEAVEAAVGAVAVVVVVVVVAVVAVVAVGT